MREEALAALAALAALEAAAADSAAIVTPARAG